MLLRFRPKASAIPAARPRRRRVFAGILSRAELAVVRDEEPPDRGFEWMALESGIRNRDPKSRAALAWRSAQPATLREWIRRHPGTRPRCWWAFDAPELLRAVVRGRAEVRNFEDIELGRPPSWFDWTDNAAIESQASYLKRHGLMTAGESRRLPTGAFEAEPIRPRFKPKRFRAEADE